MCTCSNNFFMPYQTKYGRATCMVCTSVFCNWVVAPFNLLGLLLICCPVDADVCIVKDEIGQEYYVAERVPARYTKNCPCIANACLTCDDQTKCCWGYLNDDPNEEWELVPVGS
jgi:hypothetical protein